MSQSRPIGIDLGTTRAAIAQVDERGRSSMVRHPQGDLLIPSVVYFEDDELLFGREAKQAAASTPQRAAEAVKRDLGQPSYSRAVDGQLLPAEFLEAASLKHLIADVAAQGNF